MILIMYKLLISKRFYSSQIGRTALHIAAYEGHIQIVEYLVGNGAYLDLYDKVFYIIVSSTNYFRLGEHLFI